MKHISPEEFHEQVSKNNHFLLIDVREEHEHKHFNIGGALIPLSELFQHIDQIPRDQELIIYCKMGIRSQIAIQRLEERFGFTNLVNLRGGLEALKKLRKVN